MSKSRTKKSIKAAKDAAMMGKVYQTESPVKAIAPVKEPSPLVATGIPTFLPVDVSKVDMAFGASDPTSLLPPDGPVPPYNAPSSRLAADFFFYGLEDFSGIPKEGVDINKALRHIKSVLGSFALPHEVKMASVARLFDM